MGTIPLLLLIAVLFAASAQVYARRSIAAKCCTALCAPRAWLVVLPVHGARELSRTLLLRPPAEARLIAENESQYSYIAVLAAKDDPTHREMLLDKLVHSRVDLDNPRELGYEYAWVCDALVEQFHPGNIDVEALILGGGGYVFPRYLELTRPGSHIVVAEIDTAVTEMAHRAFGLPRDTTIEIHNMDARNLVTDLLRLPPESRPRFDCIFGDSISDYTVPQHLTTLEFTRDIRALLKDGGFYTITAIDVFASGRFLAALVNTCQQVFRYVYVADTGRVPEERDSFVIVSSDRPLDLTRLADHIAADHDYLGRILPGPDIARLLERIDARILTDNYAPVENLLTAAVRTRRLTAHEIHLARARQLRDDGDLEAALAACQDALDAMPDWVDALALAGAIYYRQGNLEPAIDTLRLALPNHPEPAAVRATLCDALLAADRSEEARQLYAPLLDANPDDTEALNGLAKVAFDGQDYDQAFDYWERVLDLDPNSLNALYNLGLVDAARKNYPAAIERWSRVLMIDPNRADTRHNLAIAYLATGERDKARKELDILRRQGGDIDPMLEDMLATAPPAP